MERNIYDVLNQIQDVLSTDEQYEEIASSIDDLKYALRFKAPEDIWNFVYDEFITDFIPPKTETDYKVLSIWTTKSVEELKKVEG